MGRQQILLGRPSLTYACYHAKNLMSAFFGKDLTHNMGAFLSKNFTRNIGAFFGKKNERIT